MSEADFSLDVLPLDFEPPPRQLSVELAGGRRRCVLRLPTAGDQEELLDAGLEGEAERRSWLLARCLERYGERTDGFDLDFARGLPVRARAGARGRDRGAPARPRPRDGRRVLALRRRRSSRRSTCRSFFFRAERPRARGLLRDVHRLARAYHWAERDILALTLERRLAYLLLLEEESDAALLADLAAGDAVTSRRAEAWMPSLTRILSAPLRAGCRAGGGAAARGRCCAACRRRSVHGGGRDARARPRALPRRSAGRRVLEPRAAR